MRTVSVTASKTASLGELRLGTVLTLSADVQLTIPVGAYEVACIVRADGSGASLICADGIDDAGQEGLTTAYVLEEGEAVLLSKGESSDAVAIVGTTSARLARLGLHAPVRVMSAASLPAYTASGAGVLTADANGALTVNGVAVAAGDRVGLKDAAAGANNGIFVVTDPGDAGTPYILTPAEDFDSAGDIVLGAQVLAYAGTADPGTQYYVSAFAGTYLTDTVTFTAVA